MSAPSWAPACSRCPRWPPRWQGPRRCWRGRLLMLLCVPVAPPSRPSARATPTPAASRPSSTRLSAGECRPWWATGSTSPGRSAGRRPAYVGGLYIADALGGGQRTAVVATALLLAAAFATNAFGLRVSARIQLVLVGLLAVLLLVACVAALRRRRLGQPDPVRPARLPRDRPGRQPAVLLLRRLGGGHPPVRGVRQPAAGPAPGDRADPGVDRDPVRRAGADLRAGAGPRLPGPRFRSPSCSGTASVPRPRW